MIDIRDIEDSFQSIQTELDSFNYNEARNISITLFNNIRAIYSKEEFSDIINESKFKDFQKQILLDIYDNGKDISDHLSFQLAAFSNNSVNSQLELFEELIFTEDFYRLVNKKSQPDILDKSYLDTMLFLRNNILPNINLEMCAKYYIYISSGNFYNDFQTDESFRNAIQKNPTYYIEKKISKHLEYWKIERSYANETDCYIKKDILKYSNYGFEGKSVVDDVLKNTPAGYFDVVMKSPVDNKYFIGRANNNLVESDIYNHLQSRIAEEAALNSMLENSDNAKAIIYDFCKGHKKNLLNKFIKENINEDSFNEIKKIFDIILHKAVSEITGHTPIIIQVGDTKYNIEQEDFLTMSIKMTDFMLNNKLSFDNKFVIDILNKSTEWMTTNLMKNIKFYEPENLEKCNTFLKNIYKIKRNNNIINSPLEKELDHLENKLHNIDSSKQKLIIDSERNHLLYKKNNFNKNNIIAFISKDDHDSIMILRNEIIDHFSNLSYILSDPDKYGEFDTTPLYILPFISRENNKQYDIFEKVFDIEVNHRDSIVQSLKNRIKINDPLLELLYKSKDNITCFDNTYSIDSLLKIQENIKEVLSFLKEEGPIYNYFKKKDDYNTDLSFDKLNGFLIYEMEETYSNISKFIEKMEPKLGILHTLLNSEINSIDKQLLKINELQIKIENKEKIPQDELNNFIKKSNITHKHLTI